MAKKIFLENKQVHFISLAIGCFFALHLGDHATAFLMGFLPEFLVGNYFFHRIIPSTIGYGLTGFLLGYSLSLIFKKSTIKFIKYTPLVMIAVLNIQVYINFLDPNSSGYYSPYKLLWWLITSIRGYQILIVLPVFAILSVFYINSDSDLEIKNIKWEIFAKIKNLLAEKEMSEKIILIAILAMILSFITPWSYVDFLSIQESKMIGSQQLLIFSLLFAYPIIKFLSGKRMHFFPSIMLSTLSTAESIRLLSIYYSENYIREWGAMYTTRLGPWLALLASIVYFIGCCFIYKKTRVKVGGKA